MAHRILYYLYNNTSEKYGEWRSITIEFLYRLFQIMEMNPGINLIFLKSVGLSINYKNQGVLYMRFNKRYFTVYLSPGDKLYKICEDIFTSEFNSDWDYAYRVSTVEEVNRLINYLESLEVPPMVDSKGDRIIPTWIKEFVLERDSYRCVSCKSKDDLHFDHIIPYSKGGTSHNPNNIQLLCQKCNLQKSDTII